MSHPYDASTKFLVTEHPADWLALCERPAHGEVEALDVDLATVTAAADRVLRIHDDPPWLFHLELQANRDPGLAANLHLWNALLERRYGPPVHSMVVLLRESAEAGVSGVLERGFSGEHPYLVFRYQVVRVWQIPVETILAGGVGILPLAPLSRVAERDLPVVIEKMNERIAREGKPGEQGKLWTATYVLMGLRYSSELAAQLLQRIHQMKESVTYQAIVEEGRAEGRAEGRTEGQAEGRIRTAREFLILIGQKRLGAPDEQVVQTIESLDDLEKLRDLAGRVLDVSSWHELLAGVNGHAGQ
jgi:predicted transposase YdaD